VIWKNREKTKDIDVPKAHRLQVRQHSFATRISKPRMPMGINSIGFSDTYGLLWRKLYTGAKRT